MVHTFGSVASSSRRSFSAASAASRSSSSACAHADRDARARRGCEVCCCWGQPALQRARQGRLQAWCNPAAAAAPCVCPASLRATPALPPPFFQPMLHSWRHPHPTCSRASSASFSALRAAASRSASTLPWVTRAAVAADSCSAARAFIASSVRHEEGCVGGGEMGVSVRAARAQADGSVCA